MSYTLVIAEKPSVAKDIARVLGAPKRARNDYRNDRFIVTSCFGHLVGLAEPEAYDPSYSTWRLNDLPILPDSFKLEPSSDRGARKQLAFLTGLLDDPDVEAVVNACDAAREGEAIFRYVYEWAGCSKPVHRLWVSSMTDEALREGFRKLAPGSAYDTLADSARCRAEADWLLGMNGTRAYTCRAQNLGVSGQTFSVGRVQTPTLALVVERDAAIASFVSAPFWKLELTVNADGTTFRAVAVDHEETELRWNVLAEAKACLAAIAKAHDATVKTVESTTRQTQPPLLYDLTSLQKEANTRLGFSAQRTLDLAQALYQNHKLLTYPRTDSAYITRDLRGTLGDRLRASATALNEGRRHLEIVLETSIASRVVNDGRVTDHHAILPTETPRDSVELTPDEASLYELVTRRLFATHLPNHVKAHTSIVLGIGEATFLAKGAHLVELGWHGVDPPRTSSEDAVLPLVKEGESLRVSALELTESRTKPASRYTEASLLGAMETAGSGLEDPEAVQAMKGRGLGTPATRASILEGLLGSNYLEREGKFLVSTAIGRELIAGLPSPTFKSAALTGRWERGLELVCQGKLPREEFMKKVVGLTRELVDGIRTTELSIEAARPESLGECPLCRTDVAKRGKVYTCERGYARECEFVIFGKRAKKTITDPVVQRLLALGYTKSLSGFKSKAGKKFSAYLYLDEHFKLQMCFSEDELRKAGYRP